MIILYGKPVSNYFNTVLAILHYKKIPCREVHLGGSQDSDFLRKSPMGKIPFIEDNGVYLSETTAIIDYLDNQYPSLALYPENVLSRARVLQLMSFVELYIDAPARRLFPGVFWFEENQPIHLEEVLPIIERGLRAVDQLVVCAPYLLGAEISSADFYAYFALNVVSHVVQKQYGQDILKDRAGIKKAFNELEKLPFMASITDQRDSMMAAYLQQKSIDAGSVDS